MRAFLVAAFGAITALTLANCAAVDNSVAPRYDTLSRNFAEARNQAILLNIVRAAHDDPLSFSAISQAIPQLANATTLALPTFAVGPAFCPRGTTCTLGNSPPGRGFLFSNTTASDAVTIQTQFTLSTQETKEFYNGLLRPVDLYTLGYFIRQGYSRELLFWLFADSVQVNAEGHAFGYKYNPPYSFGCAFDDPHHHCFRDWAEIATISGLTVEQRKLQQPKEAEESKASTAKAGSAKATAETVSRLCFDTVLAKEGMAAMAQANPSRLEQLRAQFLGRITAASLSPRCGSAWPNPSAEAASTDTLEFTAGNLKFRIVPRSAYAIYEFLGKLLKLKLARTVILPPPGVLLEQVQPQLSTVAEDANILNVVPDGGGPDCFSHVYFGDGEYCVPIDAANTKRIFGLLAQLTALQTTASDLAITPVVHTVE